MTSNGCHNRLKRHLDRRNLFKDAYTEREAKQQTGHKIVSYLKQQRNLSFLCATWALREREGTVVCY